MPQRCTRPSLAGHSYTCRFEHGHHGGCQPLPVDTRVAEDRVWRSEVLGVLHRIAGALEAIAATRSIVLHADATSAEPDQPEGDTIA